MCLSRFIAAFFLASATQSGALAQASSQDKQLCSSLSRAAGTVMMARQNGASMAELMEQKIKGMQTLWEMMVEEAFTLPRYTSDSYRERAEQDFANEWYLRCLKSGKK